MPPIRPFAATRLTGLDLALSKALEERTSMRLTTKTCLLVLTLGATTPALAQDAGLPSPPTPNNAAPQIVHGIDVSAYQEHIDWSKVASSGIKFAFIRAYEGETFD